MIIGTSSDAKPDGSDLAIVTVVLQYGVFARDYVVFQHNVSGDLKKEGETLITLSSQV
tara:strand:+ start:81 stop:254 length:174 start_codon:yes stop_codon:yes gene_type:complete